MLILVFVVLVGLASGFAISMWKKGKSPWEIFGTTVAVAIVLYALLVGLNLLSFYLAFIETHKQLLNVTWSLDPYLLQALSFVLAAVYFLLTPTIFVALTTFNNKKLATTVCGIYAGTCILLYLLSLASPHKRFFDENGNPIARYYRDPDTKCIELFFNTEIRVHPTYKTALDWVNTDVVRDWEKQQKLGNNPASCDALSSSSVKPDPAQPAVALSVAQDPNAVPQQQTAVNANPTSIPAVTPPSYPLPEATTERSAVLHYQGPPVPKGGTVIFDNLPKPRLKFTYDHSLWALIIKINPDGSKKVALTSLKDDNQTVCDLGWEIIN